ncbi:MAG TPA: hypothetical protein VFN87_03365 [Solirubrobacteraceae bacterium]|nr:hypothetical protein [Solirubrobacteraceae bacterium]
MARVVAFVPDLLFGSNVVGALQAGGHVAVLVSRSEELAAALADADVLVVDLTAEAPARIEAARVALAGAASAASAPDGPRSLAFFSHVEKDVRKAAEAAGFDLVVPRSRMARAGADLVSQLVG